MPRYAELIYNGFWFTPEREMLQALIDKSQEHVEGEVRLKLYKGNVMMTGRESAKSLYSSTLVTFEDDKGAYDQKDAEGFIRLNALRLRTLGMRRKKTRSSTSNAPLRSCPRADRALRVADGHACATTGRPTPCGTCSARSRFATGSALIAGGAAGDRLSFGRRLHPRRHPVGGVPDRRAHRRGAIRVRADRASRPRSSSPRRSWALTALGVGTWWMLARNGRAMAPPRA